jgi:hypothetical protein
MTPHGLRPIAVLRDGKPVGSIRDEGLSFFVITQRGLPSVIQVAQCAMPPTYLRWVEVMA